MSTWDPSVTLVMSAHGVQRGGVVDIVCDGCEEAVTEPHGPLVCIERLKARNTATGAAVSDFHCRQKLVAWLKSPGFRGHTLLPKTELIAAIEAGIPWGDS